MRTLGRIGAIAIVLLVGVATIGITRADKPAFFDIAEDVSMIRLIAAPERYDGKKVRVIGFACLGFEADVVFIHEDDYRRAIPKNALALRLTDQAGKMFDLKAAHLKYVIVEGTFSAAEMGHMRAASGGIVNVTRLQPWDYGNGK
jgi:hypothetical protein